MDPKLKKKKIYVTRGSRVIKKTSTSYWVPPDILKKRLATRIEKAKKEREGQFEDPDALDELDLEPYKNLPEIPEPKFNEDDVILSWYDSDLNLVIDDTFTTATPLYDGGFCYLQAGARATYGFTSGKVCFEVRLLKTCKILLKEGHLNTHVLRVGWSPCKASLALGADDKSYGYDSTGKASTITEMMDYGKILSTGDVVGAFLDMNDDNAIISFTVNGEDMGVAFEVPQSVIQKEALFPHVLTKNISYQCNFLGKMAWFSPKEGYTFVGDVPKAKRIAGYKRPNSKADCEVIMMSGLPKSGKSAWVNELCEKNPGKYYIIDTSRFVDRMEMKDPIRKSIILRKTRVMGKLLGIAMDRRRNYILDQINVVRSEQVWKLGFFPDFKRRIVVVTPSDEEFEKRIQNIDDRPAGDLSWLLQLKAKFMMPTMKCPKIASVTDNVEYIGLDEEAALKLIKRYNHDAWKLGFKPHKHFVVPSYVLKDEIDQKDIDEMRQDIMEIQPVKISKKKKKKNSWMARVMSDPRNRVADFPSGWSSSPPRSGNWAPPENMGDEGWQSPSGMAMSGGSPGGTRDVDQWSPPGRNRSGGGMRPLSRNRMEDDWRGDLQERQASRSPPRKRPDDRWGPREGLSSPPRSRRGEWESRGGRAHPERHSSPRRRGDVDSRFAGRLSPPRRRSREQFRSRDGFQGREDGHHFDEMGGSPPRGMDRSPPRNMGRSPPRGMGRSPLRGVGRSPLRGVGRSPPTGMGRSPPRGRGRSPPRGMGRSPLRGMGRSPPRGIGRSPPRGMGRTPPRGVGRSPARGMGRSPARGMGRSPRRVGRSPPRGVGRSPPRDVGRSPPRGMGRSPPRGVGRSPPRGMGRSPPRGMGRSPVRGMGRSPPRGMGRSPPRGMGRSPPRGVGRSPPRGMGRGDWPPCGATRNEEFPPREGWIGDNFPGGRNNEGGFPPECRLPSPERHHLGNTFPPEEARLGKRFPQEGRYMGGGISSPPRQFENDFPPREGRFNRDLPPPEERMGPYFSQEVGMDLDLPPHEMRHGPSGFPPQRERFPVGFPPPEGRMGPNFPPEGMPPGEQRMHGNISPSRGRVENDFVPRERRLGGSLPPHERSRGDDVPSQEGISPSSLSPRERMMGVPPRGRSREEMPPGRARHGDIPPQRGRRDGNSPSCDRSMSRPEGRTGGDFIPQGRKRRESPPHDGRMMPFEERRMDENFTPRDVRPGGPLPPAGGRRSSDLTPREAAGGDSLHPHGNRMEENLPSQKNRMTGDMPPFEGKLSGNFQPQDRKYGEFLPHEGRMSGSLPPHTSDNLPRGGGTINEPSPLGGRNDGRVLPPRGERNSREKTAGNLPPGRRIGRDIPPHGSGIAVGDLPSQGRVGHGDITPPRGVIMAGDQTHLGGRPTGADMPPLGSRPGGDLPSNVGRPGDLPPRGRLSGDIPPPGGRVGDLPSQEVRIPGEQPQESRGGSNWSRMPPNNDHPSNFGSPMKQGWLGEQDFARNKESGIGRSARRSRWASPNVEARGPSFKPDVPDNRGSDIHFPGDRGGAKGHPAGSGHMPPPAAEGNWKPEGNRPHTGWKAEGSRMPPGAVQPGNMMGGGAPQFHSRGPGGRDQNVSPNRAPGEWLPEGPGPRMDGPSPRRPDERGRSPDKRQSPIGPRKRSEPAGGRPSSPERPQAEELRGRRPSPMVRPGEEWRSTMGRDERGHGPLPAACGGSGWPSSGGPLGADWQSAERGVDRGAPGRIPPGARGASPARKQPRLDSMREGGPNRPYSVGEEGRSGLPGSGFPPGNLERKLGPSTRDSHDRRFPGSEPRGVSNVHDARFDSHRPDAVRPGGPFPSGDMVNETGLSWQRVDSGPRGEGWRSPGGSGNSPGSRWERVPEEDNDELAPYEVPFNQAVWDSNEPTAGVFHKCVDARPRNDSFDGRAHDGNRNPESSGSHSEIKNRGSVWQRVGGYVHDEMDLEPREPPGSRHFDRASAVDQMGRGPPRDSKERRNFEEGSHRRGRDEKEDNVRRFSPPRGDRRMAKDGQWRGYDSKPGGRW